MPDWFRSITGIKECNWDFKLNSLPKKVIYNAGDFNEIKLDILKIKAERDQVLAEKKKINVRMRETDSSIEDFDTSALQVYGKNNTLYQVASNFNCLEAPTDKSTIFDGGYFNRIMYDITQGPSASAGAAYGAIHRLAIHRKKKINLLSETKLKSKNGKLSGYKDMEHDYEYNNIKLGILRKTVACFDRSYDIKFISDGPVIDQIFTSTVNISKTGSESNCVGFLRAAYEGVYLTAIINGNKKIVLTLVGGGVFCNPYEIIFKEIINAHKKYNMYLVPNCEILLPIFNLNSEKKFTEYLDSEVFNIL